LPPRPPGPPLFPYTTLFRSRALEYISYHAIEASCRLAQERGSFPAFAQSRWARGLVPIDTWVALQRERGAAADADPTLDWDRLRALVRHGIRNGALLAIAPTATTSPIAGTTPSLDPYYANVFSRQTLSGKGLELDPVLVAELRSLGLWEQVRHRVVEERGDVCLIEDIPRDVRRRFPSAYQLPPEAYIEV